MVSTSTGAGSSTMTVTSSPSIRPRRGMSEPARRGSSGFGMTARRMIVSVVRATVLSKKSSLPDWPYSVPSDIRTLMTGPSRPPRSA
jgi:hypothetical protein